jgi:hypothetical protein
MSRPHKIGLDYFPLDVQWDEKIKTIISIFGNDGLSWIITFWQSAYRDEFGRVNTNKYFGEVLAKDSRNTIEKQAEIIKISLEISLIKEIEPGIYTSNGIQKRIKSVSSERSSALKRYFNTKEKNIKLKKSKVKGFGCTSAKYKSFDEYKNEELTEYTEILKNQKWIDLQKKYHPNLDILLSLEKSHTQFWGTEAGWEYTKKKRAKTKNWQRTFENALSQKCNQVWLSKGTQKTGFDAEAWKKKNEAFLNE